MDRRQFLTVASAALAAANMPVTLVEGATAQDSGQWRVDFAPCDYGQATQVSVTVPHAGKTYRHALIVRDDARMLEREDDPIDAAVADLVEWAREITSEGS